MKQATRAAVLQAPRRFNIVDRPAPVAAAGEAVVRISSTAVCHTDLSIFTGEHPGVKYPVVLGHEATGGQPIEIRSLRECIAHEADIPPAHVIHQNQHDIRAVSSSDAGREERQGNSQQCLEKRHSSCRSY